MLTGLPEYVNTEEFSKVWDRCKDLRPEPMTLLPALLSDSEEVSSCTVTSQCISCLWKTLQQMVLWLIIASNEIGAFTLFSDTHRCT